MDLDQLQPDLKYWAHYKIDPKNKLFHFLSIQQGPVLKLQIISTDFNLKVTQRRKFNLPRASYFHDWFFTEKYFGFILHPAIVSLKTLLSVSLGLDTFSEALKWEPSKGNIVCLVDRSTGVLQSFESKSCWMWHSVNAYDQGDDVIVDFIGSEEGGGLGDSNSPLFAIMKNQDVPMPMKTTNHLRRYHIKPKQKNIEYQTLNHSGNFELPTVSVYERGQKHNHSHFIHAHPGEFFARGLSEWNQARQELSTFFSSSNEYFSEPLAFSNIFAPSDYISSLVYSGDVKKSFLAIFKVGQISDGPVAKVWLQHHAPLGFHGYWQAGQ
jgi:all-trans-8'-apo-beta-carotenal 15,15'-oxygenase